MADQNEKWHDLRLTIHRSLESALDPEENRVLQESLLSDPEARRCYIDFMMVYSGLFLISNDILSSRKSDENYVNSLLWVLSKEEKSAPQLGSPEEMAHRDSAQERISANQLHRKPISGKDRLRFLGRLAAIVMISVSLIWVDRWVWRKAQQPKAETDVVAMLADQIAAQWDPDLNLCFPDGRMPQGRYGILEGFVSMRFNSGAEVVLEGPAQWRLDTEDRMYLFHGKLYADVPKQAVGFSVLSAHAKVVDLGTEFGLEVTGSGSTELYVTLGKVSLLSGASGRRQYQEEISEGSARQIDALGDVREIMLDSERFVRQIDSRKNVVWRGHEHIDLADIVGGGYGFGTGTFESFIDPRTGTSHKKSSIVAWIQPKYLSQYVAVAANPLIDGVFVPDGEHGPAQISSQGHEFAECPDTTGEYWVGIQNGGLHYVTGQIKKHALRLKGIRYDSSQRPAIFIHANQGITFDLEQVRRSLPDNVKIERFTSWCGLSESVFDSANYYSDKDNPNINVFTDQELLPAGGFWVLVDGQLRFSKTGQMPDQSPVFVNIPISHSARFLTIVTTDNNRTNGYVWSLLGEPRLHLESNDQFTVEIE